MKILVFIETDVVVRHFIYSDAFKLINNKHEVVYVFPKGDKRLGDVKLESLKLDGSRIINLSPCIRRLKLWRMRFFVEKIRDRKEVSKKISQRWRKNFTNGNPKYALFLYRFLGLPIIFKLFTFGVNFLISKRPNNDLIKILNDEKPDILMHPSILSGMYIDDLIFYGNKINIPVIILMNSWDNPVSKRSVVNKNYHLLVWGPQTKNHAIKYMGLSEKNVLEFGSAQFDIYNSVDSENSDILRKKYRFKKNEKILLYAGSSKYTDEFSHLKKIDEAIDKGSLPKISVIYRPHPWGRCGFDGDRFKDYKFTNVVFDLNMRDYIFRDFKKESARVLPPLKPTNDLLKFVDIVLSPLSTILLESMMVGNIPICLLADQEKNAEQFRWTYGDPHFDELFTNKNVIVLKNSNYLISGIKKALNKSNFEKNKLILKKESEFFISKFKDPFNLRLLKLVESISQDNKQS